MLRPTNRVRRRVLLGGMLAAATGAGTGCAADWSPELLRDGTRAGQSADNGMLVLRNVVAVSAQDGVGTLVMTVFNESNVPDALKAAQLENGQATIRPNPSIIPASGITVYGVDSSQTTDPDHVILEGPPIKAGFTARAVFVFERSAPVDVEFLVKAQTGSFSEVPVPEAG